MPSRSAASGGLEGTRRSVALYKRVLTDIDVEVEEQVVDGDLETWRSP